MQPAKPVVREESPDEIEALDAPPVNTTQQPITTGSSLKRGAPDDGDVALGDDEGQKKRRLAKGEEVIEID